MDETAEARPEITAGNPLETAPIERVDTPPDPPTSLDVGSDSTPPSEEPAGGIDTRPGVTPTGRHRRTGLARLRAAWPGGPTDRPQPPHPPATKPDATKPDAVKPDATKPDATKPDATKPDGAKPDGAKPEAAKPERVPLRSRPGVGLTVAGLLMLTLLITGAAAGAVVIPGTAGVPANRAGASDADPSDATDDADGSELVEGDEPDDLFPEGDDPSDGADSGYGAGRPADALAAWAVPLAAKVSIPATALQAYGYAELVVAHSTPACKLSWTTLAGIGKIESDHGRGNGASLTIDGKSLPSIRGLPLDGTGGRDAIPDTDDGQLDGDPTWDRAVGPMQFIPASWKRYAVDADNDGVTDPNDIDDATLAAANYLCASGRDLSTPAGWNAAVLAYNAVRVYANDVFAAANNYGVRSRGSG